MIAMFSKSLDEWHKVEYDTMIFITKMLNLAYNMFQQLDLTWSFRS